MYTYFAFQGKISSIFYLYRGGLFSGERVRKTQRLPLLR